MSRHDARPPRDGGQPVPHRVRHPLLERHRQDGQGVQAAGLVAPPLHYGCIYRYKVWKPPGSWGEEWHGLQELDLTTAGMVAEDVDRLEKQLRGAQACNRM